MKLSLLEFRQMINEIIVEEDEKKEKKPSDPRKKIGKLVKYLDRPFRVRDIFTRPTAYGTDEVFYVGTFDDEENSALYHAPADKIARAPANRAKKPEDFNERDFTEQDVEAFLRAAHQEDGRPNIYHVRERWAEISKELSWMEKYIFDSKWLTIPMAKTNEQIAAETESKLAVVRAAETRAFRKIEKIIMRDDEADHDLKVIKIARAMHKGEQPMAKILTYLRSELKNKEWMNQIDFLR